MGRLFGVELRIHVSFLLLLCLSVSYAVMENLTGGRGIVLWLLLLGAVLVREAARAIAAAWYDLPLRGILLLPTGGLLTYAPSDGVHSGATPGKQKRLAVVGPVTNILCGLVFAALILALSPHLSLIARPWISPAQLLRATVWIPIFLGLINLLPAAPLDGDRIFGGDTPLSHAREQAPRAEGSRLRPTPGQVIAVLFLIAGFALGAVVLILIGAFLLIGSRLENRGLLLSRSAESVRMADVMLTDFSTLSASDTLEDALERSVHTLQDVFPVVRGGSMVGAISRQRVVEALQSDGNGYIQGIMTRSVQIAGPEDSLVETLRRIVTGSAAQLVPIVRGERILGIITPQNLAQSISALNQRRRLNRLQDRNGDRRQS